MKKVLGSILILAGMYYLLVNLPLLLGHQGPVNFFLRSSTRELDVCVVAV